MIQWTTDELEKIKQQTLGDLRPSYYYIPIQNTVQISEDMEGYLILQSQDEKQKVLSWIKNVTQIENETTDRDALLTTYLGVRQKDATNRVTEMDAVLNQYAEMQAELITDGNDSSRYATISDLNLMIISIGKPVDEINLQRDQAFHEQNLITTLQNLLNNQQSDTDTQKELTSWQTVISAYSGQTQQSGNQTVGASKLGSLF